MACGARSGLKPFKPARRLIPDRGLNGLWSPFGFETLTGLSVADAEVMAKWPVEPVRV